MAFNRTSLLVRIHGHFGLNSGSLLDYWSTGIRLAQVGGTDVPDGPYTAFLESISDDVASFHTNMNAMVGDNCFLDDLTCAKIGTNGKYFSATAQTEHRAYVPPQAGAGAGIHSWNTALVHSLRTGAARGYASNGRMYYPAVSAIVDKATGRVGTGNVAGRLVPLKAMLDGINAAAQTFSNGLRIHVMSSVGSGMSLAVQSVRADGRLDSIERRENDQPSTYSSITLAGF